MPGLMADTRCGPAVHRLQGGRLPSGTSTWWSREHDAKATVRSTRFQSGLAQITGRRRLNRFGVAKPWKCWRRTVAGARPSDGKATADQPGQRGHDGMGLPPGKSWSTPGAPFHHDAADGQTGQRAQKRAQVDPPSAAADTGRIVAHAFCSRAARVKPAGAWQPKGARLTEQPGVRGKAQGLSKITGCGSGPSTRRTVSRGSSASTVPMPTRMASWAARKAWVTVMETRPLRANELTRAAAMLPSRLWA